MSTSSYFFYIDIFIDSLILPESFHILVLGINVCRCDGECTGLLGTAGVWLDLIVNESHSGACPADDPASDECVRSGYTWFDESSVLWDMWQSLGFQFNLPLNQQVPYWQLPTAKIQFPKSDSIEKFVVCQRGEM